MSEVPSGWTRDPLGEVATLQRGMDLPLAKRRGGAIPVYGANGVDGWHDRTPLEGPGVITGRSGSIGNVRYEPSPYWPLNTTLYVKNFHGNSPKYVRRLLQWFRLERFVAATGVPTLNRNFVHPLPVIVPPIGEQRRIAEILDTLDEAIRKTEEVIAKLEKMKQGLLHDLLTRGIDENGELRDPERHPEQFKDSPLGRIPREWEVEPLGDKLTAIQAGWSPSCDDEPPTTDEWGVLKVSAVSAGIYRWAESKRLPRGLMPRPDIEVNAGDVLCVRANGVADLVAQTVFVPETPPLLMLSDKTLRLCPVATLDGHFLAEMMMAPATRRQVQRLLNGSSGQKNVSQAQLRTLRLALPRVSEQQRIVDQLKVFAGRIEAETTWARELRNLKRGLIDDLLTGRVRVNTQVSAV